MPHSSQTLSRVLFRFASGVWPPALLLACLLIAGCGEGPTDPEARRVATTGAGAVGERPEAGSAPADRDEVGIRILLRKAEDGSPLFSSKLIFLKQTTEDPQSVVVEQAWTDGSGVAEHEIGQAYRLAVLTEYDHTPREIAVTGKTTEIKISVATEFPVSGRVVDFDGRPLPAAEVLVCTTPGDNLAPPLPPPTGGLGDFAKKSYRQVAIDCRTDGDGCFEGTVNHRQTLVVAAAAPGYLTAGWRFIQSGDGKKAALPVDVVMRPAARLRVLFLNMRDLPIRNAPVFVRETDLSAQLRQYRERITAPFRFAGKTDADGVAGFDVPAGLDLAVEIGATRGRIRLFPWDEKGRQDYDFIAGKPLGNLCIAAGETVAVIATPVRQIGIRCSVRDKSGKPVVGAALSLPGVTARTDAGGNVSTIASYNEAEGRDYVVTRSMFLPFRGTFEPIAPGGSRQIAIEVTLEPAPVIRVDAGPGVRGVWLFGGNGVSLSGRVAGGAEALVPEETLLPSCSREGTEWLFCHQPGSSVEAVLVQSGDFSFHVERNVLVKNGGRVVVHPPDPGPGIRLEGRVVIPAESKPHTINMVIMRNDIPELRRFDPFGLRGSGGWASVPVEGDGSFVVEGLVPGRYALGVSLVEWGVRTDSYGELTVEPGRTPPLFELACSPSQGKLEIVVENGAGEPVPGAGLLLLDPVDSPVAASPTMGSRFFTDGAGKIVFPEMTAGRYGFVLFGRPDRQGAAVTGRVAVSAGGRQVVKIVLAD
jgi:hypothetical protein